MDNEMRILMLEDVNTDAELIERELRHANISFVIERVQSREEFLRQLKGFCPDIVLADYTLPEFSGMEALELLKV